MPADDTTRILVKITESADPLAAAPSTARLRPLYPPVPGDARPLTDQPRWFLADLPVKPTSPWDIAHQQIAGTLNLEPSAIIFAEPDLLHTIYPDDSDPDTQLRWPATTAPPTARTPAATRSPAPTSSPGTSTTLTRLRAARVIVTLQRAANPDRPHRRAEPGPAHFAGQHQIQGPSPLHFAALDLPASRRAPGFGQRPPQPSPRPHKTPSTS